MSSSSQNLTRINGTRGVPQSVSTPARGKDQIENSTGGFVFEITPMQKLDRFLILGTEGGSFYATEKKLNKDSCANLLAMIKADGVAVVDRCIEISASGRAKNNDYALFALAMAAHHGNNETKKAVERALQLVARTGTHFFHFIEFAGGLRGWGRSFQRSVANWYQSKDVIKLAYSMVKYQSRDGWSHRDTLRLAHPNPGEDVARSNLYKWATSGPNSLAAGDLVPEIINVYEKAKTADNKTLVKLIIDYNLSHEMIPNEAKSDPAIWEALLQKMNVEATVRNLGKMTSIGLVANFSEASKLIIDRFNNVEAVKKSMIHPLTLYVGRKTYAQGRGDKGSLSWSPDSKIVKALEDGFYHAFQTIQPSGKNMLLGIDVSGSMTGNLCAGLRSLTAAEGAAIMAMVTARREAHSYMFGFADSFIDLNIDASDRFETVFRKVQKSNFGATNVGLAVDHALKNKWPVDAFCIYTDNEVNQGNHTHQILNKFRKDMNKPDAKLIMCGMSVNGFSVADPKDPNSLDVVGFDTATPAIISSFAAGLI